MLIYDENNKKTVKMLIIKKYIIYKEEHMKEGHDENMGMTNKQFQGFIRLIVLVNKLIKNLPQDARQEAEKELEDTLQSMKEDS